MSYNCQKKCINSQIHMNINNNTACNNIDCKTNCKINNTIKNSQCKHTAGKFGFRNIINIRFNWGDNF